MVGTKSQLLRDAYAQRLLETAPSPNGRLGIRSDGGWTEVERGGKGGPGGGVTKTRSAPAARGSI